MSLHAVKAELLAIRARVDSALEALEHGEDAPSEWRTVGDYAAYANVSPETVRDWIKRGMPATGTCIVDGKMRLGRAVRVRIDDADAWRLKR